MSARPALAVPPFEIRPERPADAPAVERVIARAFGPGRFAKTAERLREGGRFRPDLSFTAWSGGELAGAVRLWTVEVGGVPLAFLGPIAVEADHRGAGLGAALVQAAVGAAEMAGEHAVLLVGDPPFFGPLGFERARGIDLPGPVDRARILVRTFGAAAPAGLALPPTT